MFCLSLFGRHDWELYEYPHPLCMLGGGRLRVCKRCGKRQVWACMRQYSGWKSLGNYRAGAEANLLKRTGMIHGEILPIIDIDIPMPEVKPCKKPEWPEVVEYYESDIPRRKQRKDKYTQR